MCVANSLAMKINNIVANALNIPRIQQQKLTLNVDFFRTHRYNYDYAEVSGEESMEEFIKNTDSSDSASDTDNSGKDTKCFVSLHIPLDCSYFITIIQLCLVVMQRHFGYIVISLF
jgi:hypothetical protein